MRLPAVRCEFGKMKAKYQMHLRLRKLTSPPDTPVYPPIEISKATLGTSVRCFLYYLKTQFLRSICVRLMTVLYVITRAKLLVIFYPHLVHFESSMGALDIAEKKKKKKVCCNALYLLHK